MNNFELLKPLLPQLPHLCQLFGMSEDDLIGRALDKSLFEHWFLDALPLQEQRKNWEGDASVFFTNLVRKAASLFILVNNGVERVDDAKSWAKYDSGASIVEDFDLRTSIPGLNDAVAIVFDRILRSEDRIKEAQKQLDALSLLCSDSHSFLRRK